MKKLFLLCLVLLVWPFQARGELIGNTLIARLEAQALLQALNAELLSHDSATLTLERWCGAHRLASDPKVRAELVRGEVKMPGLEVRNDLGIASDKPVKFRHVKLWCGDRLLSEADNWYLPEVLSVAMNETLDTSDTPFGKVVKPLGFTRHTLSAELLWHPLPDGWEMSPLPKSGDGALDVPPEILRHRAILTTASGKPFSEVVETYRAGLFAFPLPKP